MRLAHRWTVGEPNFLAIPPSMRPRGFIRLSGLALIKRNNTAAQQCMHIRNDVVVESGINGDADHGLGQAVMKRPLN